MLFNIFNNFAFVDIKSVGKFLKKHILCKTKIILVRETQLFPAFGKLHAELVEGDDHCYNRHLDRVVAAVQDWLQRQQNNSVLA